MTKNNLHSDTSPYTMYVYSILSINEAMRIKMQDPWQRTADSEAPRLWWSFLFCL